LSLDRLEIRGFRNLAPTTLSPGPGVNWLSGKNGAGKTSVLEAIFLLARGRSFRVRSVGAVIQHGAQSLRVVARLRESGIFLGIERDGDDWRGRIDGRDSHRISEFASALPLVLIEPDSHRLIDGGPDRRRQFLDWQLFHVEPSYLESWQRYARLLRQRNAALRSGASGATLSALEAPMVSAALRINALRTGQVEALSDRIRELLKALNFRFPGEIGLRYRPGHPPDIDLAAALADQRASDQERGFTQRGPHRAELVLTCEGYPAAVEMSRGQQKLLAIVLLLAQLVLFERHASHRPLLLLDDPVSELDSGHLEQLLDWVEHQDFQTWVTATHPGRPQHTMFHVEHGKVSRILDSEASGQGNVGSA
jgi:DNA replication and repair protein RecF